MTDTAGPFDGPPGQWAEAQWARHAAVWATSGVYGPPAASTTTGDLPLSVSGLSVGLGAGRAWVRGFGFERTGAAVMQAVTANTHASFNRRDRIVLRRNLATHTLTPVLLQGTPSGTPVAPALTQSEAGSWDLPGFSFLVPPGSGTSISGIVDERRWVDAGGLGLSPVALTAYRANNQSITGGSPVTGVIALDTVASGASPGLTLDPATGIITVEDRAAGPFDISGALGLIQAGTAASAAPPARLYVAVLVNGVETYRGQDSHTRNGLVGDLLGRVMPTCRVTLVGGDQVAFRFYHDSSAGATIAPGANITWLSVRRAA